MTQSILILICIGQPSFVIKIPRGFKWLLFYTLILHYRATNQTTHIMKLFLPCIVCKWSYFVIKMKLTKYFEFNVELKHWYYYLDWCCTVSCDGLYIPRSNKNWIAKILAVMMVFVRSTNQLVLIDWPVSHIEVLRSAPNICGRWTYHSILIRSDSRVDYFKKLIKLKFKRNLFIISWCGLKYGLEERIY